MAKGTVTPPVILTFVSNWPSGGHLARELDMKLEKPQWWCLTATTFAEPRQVQLVRDQGGPSRSVEIPSDQIHVAELATPPPVHACSCRSATMVVTRRDARRSTPDVGLCQRNPSGGRIGVDRDALVGWPSCPPLRDFLSRFRCEAGNPKPRFRQERHRILSVIGQTTSIERGTT